MRWVGHVANMEERRGVYRVLVGKPEGKRPLGRCRHRWEDNIKMDLGRNGLKSSGSGQEKVVGNFKCGNEHLGSIQYEDFLD